MRGGVSQWEAGTVTACGTGRQEPLQELLWLSHIFHCTHGRGSHSLGEAIRAHSSCRVQKGLTVLCNHELFYWEHTL